MTTNVQAPHTRTRHNKAPTQRFTTEPLRIWTAWATYANEGLHRETSTDRDHSVQLGFSRRRRRYIRQQEAITHPEL